MNVQGFESEDKVNLCGEFKVYNSLGILTIYNPLYTANGTEVNMKIDKIKGGDIVVQTADYTTLSGVPVSSLQLSNAQSTLIDIVKPSNVRMR